MIDTRGVWGNSIGRVQSFEAQGRDGGKVNGGQVGSAAKRMRLGWYRNSDRFSRYAGNCENTQAQEAGPTDWAHHRRHL
jgi:hypothetical protein